MGGGCSGQAGSSAPLLPPAPAPELREAAAPYKAASGSPARGAALYKGGLLYKAGLVGRGAAGPGPGEGPPSPTSSSPSRRASWVPQSLGSLSGLGRRVLEKRRGQG